MYIKSHKNKRQNKLKNKAIKILEKIGSKNNSELFDQIRYLVELLTLNNSIA